MARHKVKKHQFHCEKCSSPCEIYKKGKAHRVLVCPNCGVIATNPLPLLAMAAPFAIKAAKKLLTKSTPEGEVKASHEQSVHSPFVSSPSAYYIEKALQTR